MLASLKLILALLMIAVGALFGLIAYRNWKFGYRIIIGKKRLQKQGDKLTRVMFYVIAGVLIVLGISVLFAI